MLHSIHGTKHTQQAVPSHYGNGFVRFLGIEIRNGDVRADTYYLVADFVLETNDHGYGYNHHCKPYGDTPPGDEDSRS
jgi:hypothetical protein